MRFLGPLVIHEQFPATPRHTIMLNPHLLYL
jgi:hypothetical protein